MQLIEYSSVVPSQSSQVNLCCTALHCTTLLLCCVLRRSAHPFCSSKWCLFFNPLILTPPPLILPPQSSRQYNNIGRRTDAKTWQTCFMLQKPLTFILNILFRSYVRDDDLQVQYYLNPSRLFITVISEAKLSYILLVFIVPMFLEIIDTSSKLNHFCRVRSSEKSI